VGIKLKSVCKVALVAVSQGMGKCEK
jgi:hypothetical protein